MKEIDDYLDGELSRKDEELLYGSLLQDGGRLLDVVSILGLMRRAADLPAAPEPPPELDPPDAADASAALADELIGLTMKALAECESGLGSGEAPEPGDAEAMPRLEPPAPEDRRNLPERLVGIIARLNSRAAVPPPPQAGKVKKEGCAPPDGGGGS